jgi:hypothetical protein
MIAVSVSSGGTANDYGDTTDGCASHRNQNVVRLFKLAGGRITKIVEDL